MSSWWAADGCCGEKQPMKKTVIYTVTLGSTIVVLDTTVVNIAVPDLAVRLDASITAVGWVVA